MSRFRPDIEGLRAVAVLLVILDHLAGRPRGGFVGVDVFFVISGFLITGLLLQESANGGGISIRRFYERRARRILPAALTVLAAVVVVAHLAFKGTRVKNTITDVWWSLGFSANIHFARIGTDYFAINRAPSLVQHFWSLAVEEQFYLVWPLVMIAVLAGTRRWMSRRSSLITLTVFIAAITGESFFAALGQTRLHPVTAYFSTPVRAWELGVGATLAVVLASFPSIPRRIRSIAGPLSALGLAGIAVSAFLVDANHHFPAPNGLLPVLSAAAVLLAGSGGSPGIWAIALTNRISRYLGKISYSLYLWHWPTIVTVQALIPHEPQIRYPMTVVLTLGLSIASFHFIEDPLRHARLKVKTRGRRRSLAYRQRRYARHAATVAVALCAVVTLDLVVLNPGNSAASTEVKGIAVGAPRKTSPYEAIPAESLVKQIQQSLAATTFPADLNPKLQDLDFFHAAKAWGSCIDVSDNNIGGCTFGAPPGSGKTAVVLGDSFAMSWIPGIRAALPASRWTIYGLTELECSAADVPVFTSQHPPQPFTGCDDHHKYMLQKANALNPDLVILASTPQTLGALRPRQKGAQAIATYRDGLIKTIEALHPNAKRHIIILSPPPIIVSLESCDITGAVPADCVRTINQQWRDARSAEEGAAQATHVSYSDTHLWFCDAHGNCPAFIGNMAVRFDPNHLTDVYAASLGPELAKVLPT